eukprot:CAMPEP_0178989742 /NCGR_PEP_ID=MMETSP0795-20121207/4548_1 /TAXON_ID=88552 /ORGANISM="Amoebophrya sp., Strain Ameob2" /LENGTH=470 /DNA_ID=CAMNT_0020681187 /DNA_START=67 /DNA_END=1475 /DNA_ORIENTATION=+
MAEAVELCVEQWVGSLFSLLEGGVFSKPEVDAIVETRRGHEYRMKEVGRKGKRTEYRTAVLKAIEYEIALDLLRKDRLKDTSSSSSSSVTEAGLASVRRINALFRRLVGKCRNDPKAWLQYIDFLLRSGQTKQLKEVLFQALRQHSRHAQLWLIAIKREHEEGNRHSTRALFMKALRFLPADVDILREYFKWELRFAKTKLAARLESSCQSQKKHQEVLLAPSVAILRAGIARTKGLDVGGGATLAKAVLPFLEAAGWEIASGFLEVLAGVEEEEVQKFIEKIRRRKEDVEQREVVGKLGGQKEKIAGDSLSVRGGGGGGAPPIADEARSTDVEKGTAMAGEERPDDEEQITKAAEETAWARDLFPPDEAGSEERPFEKEDHTQDKDLPVGNKPSKPRSDADDSLEEEDEEEDEADSDSEPSRSSGFEDRSEVEEEEEASGGFRDDDGGDEESSAPSGAEDEDNDVRLHP